MKKRPALLCLLILFALKNFAQTATVGSYAEKMARMNQVLGLSDDQSSFTARPINSIFHSTGDSSLQSLVASKNLLKNSALFGSKVEVKALPVTWLNDYTVNHPFGYNNGPLYPNKGYQTLLTAGVFIKAGILNIQLDPELVYAQNKPFNTFADVQANAAPNVIKAYYHVINGIDAPERFGSASLHHAYPGQSKITLIYKNVEAGVSTENLWWGPGQQNSIMISNSAPGFLHWTLNSSNPVKTAIGTFEWQLIGGILKQSGYPPYHINQIAGNDSNYKQKPVVSRYLSAFTANWHPKWVDGLFIGVSAYNYMNKDSAYSSYSALKKVIPVFSPSSDQANAAAGGDGQDFAYSVNLRQVLKEYQAEFYFEYARNDRANNFTDLFLEPEHSAAYTIGGSKYFTLQQDRFLKLTFELTHLQIPYTYLLRSEPTWYTHPDISPNDGYTNQGRYIGAGIGPGSNSLSLDVSYIKNQSSFGVLFDRYVHNNDFYYFAYGGTGNEMQWVDISTTFYANVKFKKYMVAANLSPVLNINYEYQAGKTFNLDARLAFTYFID